MLRLALALALLSCAAPSLAQTATGGGPSSAGTGGLGPAVQAGNRDCPPRGASNRAASVPSAAGAASCAPTGAGSGQGLTPVPAAPPAENKSSPNTRETPGAAGQ